VVGEPKGLYEAGGGPPNDYDILDCGPGRYNGNTAPPERPGCTLYISDIRKNTVG